MRFRHRLLIALALYVSSLFAWTPLSESFRASYSSLMTSALPALGAERDARMRALEKPRPGSDAVLVLRDFGKQKRVVAPTRLRIRAFQPLCLLLALFVVTPLPKRAWVLRLAAASAALFLVFTLQHWLQAKVLFHTKIDLAEPAGWHPVSLYLLGRSGALAFLAPLLIWFVLAERPRWARAGT